MLKNVSDKSCRSW